MEITQEKGSISIHTENIFPIIKRFLYSDHEIFLRELVSNAVDATQKIKQLASAGQYNGELGDLTIRISIDKDARTLTVSDRGLGMTADEIKKYINQIAFSGAMDFVEKFKEQGMERQAIIGQFGLGFYSAFMVADRVDLHTKSYQEGTPAAFWTCDGSTEFELGPDDRTERGTDVVLHLSADADEFLEDYRIRHILEKYGRFLPVPIEFEGRQINETQPLWTRNPAELTDEDYLTFYKTLYPFAEDPLFWIHLNVDYPFHLTGILYFPKLKNDVQLQKDKIQLYSRQVFITDEVKDIVPDFLMLLQGVIDSPDIPLNVSRSFLQADANVRKINGYITRKVADKLFDLFKNDRAVYEGKFRDIGLFIKYGMLSDDKFYEKAKDFVLLQSVGNDHFYTLAEYREQTSPAQEDKNGQLVWLYASEPARQDAYVQAARGRGYDVLTLDSPIDPHFVGLLEQKEEKLSLRRVDSAPMDELIDKGITAESILNEADTAALKTLFEEVAGKAYTVEVKPLSSDELPVVLTQNEFMRRMNDMSRSGGGGMFGQMPVVYQLQVNASHPLIQALPQAENRQATARQLFDLALLSQGQLTGASLTGFIRQTLETLSSR